MTARDDPNSRKAYLEGRYDMCRLLLTSPRMNRPQREVIEERAYEVMDELKELGVTFREREDA